MDDLYLNGYAKAVSPYATLVYLSLCRHADKEQRALPSIKRIAAEFSISPTSVKKGIKELISFNLIKKVRLGKRLSNEYWLLDKSNWVIVAARPSLKKDDGRETTGVKDASRPNDSREATTKDAQGKEAHQKDSASPSADADIPRIRKGNAEPVSLAEAVEYFKKSPQRHIQIIGDYAKAKRPDCRTGGQWYTFMKRNLRVATELAEFGDEQLESTARKIWGEEWLQRWTLETLLKYLINNH